MLVLVTYDVNTETPAGRRRLRLVAKACVNRGARSTYCSAKLVSNAVQHGKVVAILHTTTARYNDLSRR